MQTNRSGGPQTVDGKARSSRNAIKQGITSNKMFVLQNENPAAWAEMLDMCVEQIPRPVMSIPSLKKLLSRSGA